jgi:MoxR-like ATPase
MTDETNVRGLSKDSGIGDGQEDQTEEIRLLLTRKQIILYGPPGTGKTFKARRIAVDFLLGNR